MAAAFHIDPEHDTYGVMGHPVSHSQSPTIHAAFAIQTGEDLVYQAIPVEPGDFTATVASFQAAGGKGLNITLPFKREAWELVEEASQAANQAQAVNTLWFNSAGRRVGDNTDGIGLVRDLISNRGWCVQGEDILIMGAGGAVHGILGPILAAGPASVVIVNRTVSRAESLASRFSDQSVVHACGYDDISGQHFTLIINGTSASLQGETPPLPDGVLTSSTRCYDLAYHSEPTVFLHWCIAQGAATVADGLGMLAEQAAESFFRWRGVRPDTGPVIDQLRSKSIS